MVAKYGNILSLVLIFGVSFVSEGLHGQPGISQPSAPSAPVAPPPPPPAPRSVPKASPQQPAPTGAHRAFQAGQYRRAAELFRAQLQKNPNDEAAKLGLARSLYHLEDWDGSYRQFKRVLQERLDPEGSYEFGLTALRHEQYEESLQAFKRVPKGHALYDLSGYYGGIAALRLKRYQEAQDMMENAVALPKKLRRSRALYQKHIHLLLLRQQRNAMQGEQQEGAGGPVFPIAPANYAHPGIYELDRFAIISIENKVEVVDYHDLKKEANNFSTRAFTFDNGLMLPYGEGSRKHVFGFQFELYAEQKDADGLERSRDRVPDVISRKSEFTKTASGFLLLFNEWAFAENLWVNVEAKFEQEYPDFGKKVKSSKRHGGAGIGRKSGDDWVRLMGLYGQAMDTTEKRVKLDEQIVQIEAERKLRDYLKVEALAKYTNYDYKVAGIEGPKSRLRGEATFKVKLPASFKIEAMGRLDQSQDYTKYDVGNVSAVRFNQDSAKLEAALVFAPVSWFELVAATGEERNWLRDFNAPSIASIEEVKKNHASAVQYNTLWGGINLLF